MIHAKQTQLEEAYKKHNKAANNGKEKSHKLLKFYAVECGLKALYLKNNNLADTEEAGPEWRNYGHDLKALVRDCQLPNLSPPNENIGGKHYPLSKLHEYLRYFATIPSNIIDEQVAYIDRVIKQLDESSK